jgi:hypothetical protein
MLTKFVSANVKGRDKMGDVDETRIRSLTWILNSVPEGKDSI